MPRYYPVGSKVFDEQHAIIGAYLTSNWRAFRTWGLSANSPWEHHFFWSLRDGVDRSRKELKVDWENLQRPGFSPDYIDERPERWDLDFERTDWIPTADGQAILRNNMPLLAYIAGKPAAFTSKDHGEYVEGKMPEGARNLLANPGFEEGTQPWSLSYHEQYNVRRTYRRAPFLLTRLLANLGVAGQTPLLERFRSPVGAAERRWLDGFYLDQPEEWDDPYRFFRW